MKDRVRARYTLEFKQEAVKLVRGGEKISAAARVLGVSAQSLDNWVGRAVTKSTSERRHFAWRGGVKSSQW
jgi:transposase-like protein